MRVAYEFQGHRSDPISAAVQSTYRPEIDGLRALAVAAVVLFHAGAGFCAGGFLGVDVFFVISGYLITRIILSETAEGRFNLAGFYERRLRRIVPALFAVMAVSSVPAAFWMLPDELENFGQSLVAATLFVNNVLLALTTGYWALASEYKPLLHTWSLAVEGQFYFLYPMVLLPLCVRGGRWTLPVLSVVALASLGIAQWWSSARPDYAFYLLPTRAWELLVGAIVALGMKGSDHKADRLAQWMSLTGSALIVLTFVGYSSQTPTPSVYTVLPVAGTALVLIYGRAGTSVHAVLTSRILVALGLISYSVYLWHYVLFAFARIYMVQPPPAFVLGVLGAISAGLGWLTWKYVELPFRRSGLVSRRMLTIAVLSVGTALLLYGYGLHRASGMPGRMAVSGQEVVRESPIHYNQSVFRFQKDGFAQDGRLKILVSGYSYGRDFVNMLFETFDMRNVEVIYRDDFHVCIAPFRDRHSERLYRGADVIVFAYAKPEDLPRACVEEDIGMADRDNKWVFYTGTKHFGANLNWLVRLNSAQRADRMNAVPPQVMAEEEDMRGRVPPAHFISLMSPIVRDGFIPVTDGNGQLLSADRTHLTRSGARYLGNAVLRGSAIGRLILATVPRGNPRSER